MATIFPPPPKLDLPLSKGADLDVTFIYKPLVDGVPTEADWPVGSTVTAVIDAKGQVRWKRTGGDPFGDVDYLLREIKRWGL